MALVVAALWLGSLICGWLRFGWWLLVPPIILAGYVIAGMARQAMVLRHNGIDPENFYKQMMPESWRVVIWGLVQNSGLFLLSGALAKLLGH